MSSKNTLSSLASLRELSIVPGAVFIGPWAGVDHEKFLVIAGVSGGSYSGLYSDDQL